MNKKVFLGETIHEKAYELLRQNAEIISDWERAGEADALISRALEIGSPQMDCMPNLKVIAVHGTGTDGIDIIEADRRGIKVVYAPHKNANAVAELNVALILALYRKIVYAQEIIQSKRENDALSELRGMELKGKTVGLVGLGAVGSKTAKILGNGFGAKMLAYTPSLTEERAKISGCECIRTLEQLLKCSDIVCLCLPLNKDTTGIIDRNRLAVMKKGAILINTARGALVDETTLYEALKSGQLWGAACDVLCEGFPKKENPLLELPNFIAMPHIGANTEEALYNVGMVCVQQIIDVLSGKEPEYPVLLRQG